MKEGERKREKERNRERERKRGRSIKRDRVCQRFCSISIIFKYRGRIFRDQILHLGRFKTVKKIGKFENSNLK